MEQKYDVVVAGAGLAGATLALALAQGGLRVALVDPQPLTAEPGRDGRASAISYAPFRIWRTLGVAERLGDAEPIRGMIVTESRPAGAARSSPRYGGLRFDPAELDGADAGEPLGWMVDNAAARTAMAAALLTSEVVVFAPAVVEGVEASPSGAIVRLAGGKALQAAVVVAADGRDSRLRGSAGIGVSGWDYGQTALVATIAHAEPHHGIARQVFLPTGPLAILPLAGDRSSLVWTESSERAAALAAVAPEGFAGLLLRRMGDALGAVRLESARFTHPLRLQLAERHVAARLALVGDAACSVHPLAGQGLNLGLKDAAALAETLVEAARLGEDLGSEAVLARYARRRRFDAASLALATDGLRRVYAAPTAPLALVRAAGMELINRLAPVRRGLMRQAGGAAGDPPRLLRGVPL